MDLINKASKILYKFVLSGYEVAITDLMVSVFGVSAIVLLLFGLFNLNEKTASILYAFYNLFKGHFESKFGKEIEPYIQFLFALFVYIWSFNFLSLFPFVFPVTSKFLFNLIVALILFVLLFFVLFKTHGLHFYNAFAPSDAPFLIRIFLFFLEFFLFLIKPIVLSFRLACSIGIGHVMLELFSTLAKGNFSSFVVWLILVILNFVEIFLGSLQAYIFVVLSAGYLMSVLSHH